MIIGICGGSGSGKTTLLNRLSEHYAHLKPSIFTMDNYYFPIEQQVIDENGKINFDLPTALNKELLVADLKKLIQGETIEVEEYHFNSPPGYKTYTKISPSEIIIVEGLFLFHYQEVRALLDYSIFVSLCADIQLNRRIIRDELSRGYKREEIMYQWQNHVLPCYQQYLFPYEQEAEFRYRNDNHAEEDFISLTQQINQFLALADIKV